MKTNKEYPATHSMYTSWYVADEDGNVGIMDFNDNGPVPWETEETSVESLVYGHDEDYESKEFLPIALTDDQIDKLMENPHAPEEEGLWMDCIIQIDTSKEKEFLELAQNPDFEIEVCVSKERGLYHIDGYGSTSDSEVDGRYPVLPDSSLKKMIDQGIILQVFVKTDYWMNDEWVDDKIVHKKSFSKAPYFLFHQPYWVGELPVCLNVPNNPVKLNQIPEKLRERVLKVPVKFKETERFQIAEWYPCDATGDPTRTEKIGDYEYELLPLTDGSEAYICTSIVNPYCLGYHDHYHTCHDHCFTNTPTVLAIMHPLEKWDYSRQIKSDCMMLRSAWVPFFPQIPLGFQIGDSKMSWNNFGDYSLEEEISKNVNQEMLINFLKTHCQWLEDLVLRFKPRVILVSDLAKPVFDSIYSPRNNSIKIAENSYPMYLVSELEAHRKEIEQLAFMPYQGEKIPHIISIEEMEKIKQQP